MPIRRVDRNFHLKISTAVFVLALVAVALFSLLQRVSPEERFCSCMEQPWKNWDAVATCARPGIAAANNALVKEIDACIKKSGYQPLPSFRSAGVPVYTLCNEKYWKFPPPTPCPP